MAKCQLCDKEFSNNNGLSQHLHGKSHNLTYEQYLRQITIPWPKCKCGCGQDVPLTNHGTIICEFVHGHNNFTQSEFQKSQGLKGGPKSLGRYHTPESRDKISQAIVQNYQENGGPWQRGVFHSAKNNQDFVFRSSWEQRYMQQLEEDDTVLGYRYESFAVNYEWEGKNRRYLPDFVVTLKSGQRRMIEIGQKNYKMVGREAAKIEAAQKFCSQRGWEFQLLTEDYFR